MIGQLVSRLPRAGGLSAGSRVRDLAGSPARVALTAGFGPRGPFFGSETFAVGPDLRSFSLNAEPSSAEAGGSAKAQLSSPAPRPPDSRSAPPDGRTRSALGAVRLRDCASFSRVLRSAPAMTLPRLSFGPAHPSSLSSARSLRGEGQESFTLRPAPLLHSCDISASKPKKSRGNARPNGVRRREPPSGSELGVRAGGAVFPCTSMCYAAGTESTAGTQD